jgi:hypothetical protein
MGHDHPLLRRPEVLPAMTDCLAISPLVGAGLRLVVQSTSLSSSTTVLLIAVALALELALLVIALVDVLRRPDEAVTGGRRWVWILVIVLVQTLGPIVYFAAGRRPQPATDPSRDGPLDAGAAAGADSRPVDRVGRTVDVLYGQGAADGPAPAEPNGVPERPGDESSTPEHGDRD